MIKPIECEHLHLSSFRTISIPNGVEQDWKFIPLNADIIIGNKLDTPIKEAYYPLVSYFENTFSHYMMMDGILKLLIPTALSKQSQ